MLNILQVPVKAEPVYWFSINIQNQNLESSK